MASPAAPMAGAVLVAKLSMGALAQGVAPSDSATPPTAPAGNPANATEQQALPGTPVEPMNISPSEAAYRRALVECDNKPMDDQQTCRDSVNQQQAPAEAGDSEEGDSEAGGAK